MDEKLLFEEIPLENRYNLLVSHINFINAEKELLISENRKLKKTIYKLEHQIKGKDKLVESEAKMCTLLGELKTIEDKKLYHKYKDILNKWKEEYK